MGTVGTAVHATFAWAPRERPRRSRRRDAVASVRGGSSAPTGAFAGDRASGAAEWAAVRGVGRVPVADAYAKFLRAPGADGMVQMEFVGRVMEEVGGGAT